MATAFHQPIISLQKQDILAHRKWMEKIDITRNAKILREIVAVALRSKKGPGDIKIELNGVEELFDIKFDDNDVYFVLHKLGIDGWEARPENNLRTLIIVDDSIPS